MREGGLLLERLRGLSERHPAQMAGDLSDPPPGLSLRHLSRKLTKSIQSRAISDLWKRRAELGDTLRRQWTRNLPGDAPARPESYHGHGEWLHCLPGKWETTLLDPVFRLGLNQRMGFPAPGTGQQCGRNPRGARDVCTFSTPMADMLHAARKASTHADMTALETLPGKQA